MALFDSSASDMLRGERRSSDSSSIESEVLSEKVLARWQALTRDMLARGRLNAAAEDDRKEKELALQSKDGAVGRARTKSTVPTRRVSYVASSGDALAALREQELAKKLEP
jgi:hypothetical protein